jgi:hypothetical protein
LDYMVSNENENAELEDERITALRDAIRRAFPEVTYTGKVTRHDGAWLPELTEENAIHDDDMFLYEGLTGKKWTEISKQLLHDFPDGFVLLTDEALVAFLAAWLIRSLDHIDGENPVREFFVYAFSPGESSTADLKISLLRALNTEQRSAVRSLLAEFAQREPSEFIREHAASAVQMLDSLPPSLGQ